MSWKARIAAVVLAAGAALGAAVPTASAAPSGCSSGYGVAVAKAVCVSGTGYYQAYITCKNWLGWYEFKEGPWNKVGSNVWSYAYCSPGYSRVSHGIGIKN